MPLRTVETLPVLIQTSIGPITGELWSDRLAGLGLDRFDGTSADCDGYVHSATDLGQLIASLGVPRPEAGDLAATFWDEQVAPVWRAWEDREALANSCGA